MENRSYHSLSNSWDFTTGSKRSTPDQTHELIHDMEEGKAVPGYGRVASDLVDFDVLSTSRAGIVTTLAGPSTSVVKSERLIQLQHGDVNRGDTPPSTPFSPSSKRSKRGRSVNLNSQIPFCQVYGCNLNLSSSKEYHKKHKVCEMHSKTAKVIVNGLEQRFCQQCSRFHLLAEFDDGKRSCRKRLAGHNQRRRKPQIEHKHYGHKFMEMMIPSPQTPFLCANILSAGIGRELKYGAIAKGHSCVKAEAIRNYHPSSLALNQHGNSKQLSTFQASSVGICSENSERYSLEHLACVSSSSQAQLMKTFPENESFFATRGISSVSDTGCALSLLSTQPHNFFIQSSGMTTDCPLFAQSDHGSAHSNANPLSGTVPSYSRFSASVPSNRFFSSGHNRVNVDHLGALPVSDASNTDIKDHVGGTASSLDCMNEKKGMYTDQGTSNVGTFHLSSQLHGTNSHRSSMQAKMAKEDFMSCIGL